MASTSQIENGIILPKWGILGAGAMGWLWTYYLQRAKIDTLLLQRQNTSYRECIIQKDNLFENCRTSATKSDNPSLPTLEALIIATKAYSVRSALLPLQEALISKQIPIILLQNGLGVFEEVRELFSEQPILILSTSNGAYWHEYEFLKLTGTGSSYLGTLDNSVPRSLKNILFKRLKATGLPVLLTDNILKQLWEKLLVNCSINSLSALWLCRNGDLLDNPNSKQIWKRIVQEGVQMMRLELCQEVEPLEILTLIDQVAYKTSANYSSMYEDRRRNRPNEVDYIQGYLVRKAHQHHLSVPTLETLAELLKFPENSSLKQTPN
ncbi:MAG: 2-dehydropantoate 2-reductase [SAR324 cluster bacterium]|nr:2-dehydropantoate 2-reductase [SAR324 cluster bacterium]